MWFYPTTTCCNLPCPPIPLLQLKVPELQLVIAKDAWSPSEYDECPLQRIGAAGEVVGGGSRMGESSSEAVDWVYV
jgi:hypothetical protein